MRILILRTFKVWKIIRKWVYKYYSWLMPFVEKKFFHMIQFDGISSLAINSCLFFPLGLSHSRFFLGPVLSYFYQCNGQYNTHLVFQNFWKFMKKMTCGGAATTGRFAVTSCDVRASSLWLKLAMCISAVYF